MGAMTVGGARFSSEYFLAAAVLGMLTPLLWGCSGTDVPQHETLDVSSHALTNDEVSVQSPKDARAWDLSMRADERVWTLDEAEADLIATEVIGQIAEEVAQLRPDIFQNVTERTTGWSVQRRIGGVWTGDSVSTAGHCDGNFTVIQRSGNHPTTFGVFTVEAAANITALVGAEVRVWHTQ